MANALDYVKEFGHIPFSRKTVNDIDNAIFSLLNYVNYSASLKRCFQKFIHLLISIAILNIRERKSQSLVLLVTNKLLYLDNLALKLVKVKIHMALVALC